MIQRGELARDVVGLGEAGRDGAAQSETARAAGKRRQQRHGLEHVHEQRIATPGVQVVGPGGRRVGDEEQVELAALRRLRHGNVAVDVVRGAAPGVGVKPGCWMGAVGMHQRGKPHLSVRVHRSFSSWHPHSLGRVLGRNRPASGSCALLCVPPGAFCGLALSNRLREHPHGQHGKHAEAGARGRRSTSEQSRFSGPRRRGRVQSPCAACDRACRSRR
jgi:hypothetical protein